MQPTPLINLRAIHKTYTVAQQTVAVLHRITMDVHKGEMIAIVGASGSGKSTLMNIIGLLDHADSGTYLFDGDDVTLLSEDQQAHRRNRQIGFVFQQFNLLPRLSAAQNVALPLHYNSETAVPSIAERVSHNLNRVGMHQYQHHKPSQLSGGQQQRIAIARALVNNPEVILADEPTGALDSTTGAEVMKLFHQLHAQHCTLILITHDPAIAAQCGRQIYLSDGHLSEQSSL